MIPTPEASFAGLLPGWVVNLEKGCAPLRASGTDSQLQLCQREPRLLVKPAVPSRWQNLSAQAVATHPAAHPVLGVLRARNCPRGHHGCSGACLSSTSQSVALPSTASERPAGRPPEPGIGVRGGDPSGVFGRAGRFNNRRKTRVFEPQGAGQLVRLFPAPGVNAVIASGRIPLGVVVVSCFAAQGSAHADGALAQPPVKRAAKLLPPLFSETSS
ncbi:hypothetical protein lerEdw1_004790 [Lerista edwardsae]|nr:hypothetical protein lerEdw1_004790 [Lerista edwardsae]